MASLQELLHSKDPIDITGKIYICDDECLFRFDNQTECTSQLKNVNDMLSLSLAGKSSISFNNEDYCPEYDQYKLKEVLINGPARHTVMGKRHELEFELVYTSEDSKEIVVISVFGDVPDNENTNARFEPGYTYLENIADKYFPQHLKSTELHTFNPQLILLKPKERTFFSYQRSHRVKHILMENPIPIPASFLRNFKKYVVPASQYKAAMSKTPSGPGAKVIIYATVPPTVEEKPVDLNTCSQGEDEEQNFVNKVVENFDNSPVEPSDEQWGYWGVVAAISYFCILLVTTLVIWYLGGGDALSHVIEAFVRLGPAKILALVMIGVAATFGMAWVVESRSSPTDYTGKYFSYLGWYILLTFILMGIAWVFGRTPQEREGPNWFKKHFDKCPEDAIPAPAYGVALPSDNVTGTGTPSMAASLTRPAVIGVPI